MADKKITDLVLIDDVADTLSVPTDNGIQTYRFTIAQLKSFIQDHLATEFAPKFVPTGGVMPFAGTSAPSGFLLCDGSAVSRSTYATLFAAIGTAHGTGDGSTTFNLPDYRGRFLRGVAGGQSMDPDRAARTAMATGGNTGDNVGSVQGHAFQTHTHTQNAHTHTQNAHSHTSGISLTQATTGGPSYNSVTSGSGVSTSSVTATNQNTTATNQNAAASGANSQTSTAETRPVNAAVNYIIKI